VGIGGSTSEWMQARHQRLSRAGKRREYPPTAFAGACIIEMSSHLRSQEVNRVQYKLFISNIKVISADAARSASKRGGKTKNCPTGASMIEKPAQ
jgi:hypothetical protein